MFEQSIIEAEGRTQKASTIFISTLVQVGLVILGIIIPMI